MGMLECTAVGREGGPLFLTFKSVTQTTRVMEIAIRRRFWRAPHAERRISMRRRVLSSVKTSPHMIYLVNGMAAKHAWAPEKRIAGILAAKWIRQYSQMASFVRTWMCLAIVQSNTLLL
jgi:hypothetical protein